MQRMKLVLVGNGMAGVRTLEELLALALALDAPDRHDRGMRAHKGGAGLRVGQ